MNLININNPFALISPTQGPALDFGWYQKVRTFMGAVGRSGNGKGPSLLVFESLQFGMRAGFINLFQMFQKFKTMGKVFAVYGDDPDLYPALIEKKTGVLKQAEWSMLPDVDRIRIGRAVVEIETGRKIDPILEQKLKEGYRLAEIQMVSKA